jgi:signal transduction histidine kinase
LKGRGPLLTSMQHETNRLIRLVNNLLILTRADAGMLKLKLEPLDLGKLARQRCDQLVPLAAQRNVTFEVKTDGYDEILGDADRLAQVLDNLLNNAIRYSPEGEKISVEIKQQGKECCCRVHDSGPGIPKKHLTYIFERFYRVESSRSRQGGEAGLGLAIVRALIQAHNGRISADSEPGKGTTLCFFLPLSQNCHKVD